MDQVSFAGSLKWVAGSGAAILAAMLVSLLSEKSARFQAADPLVKQTVMIVSSVVLAMLAWVVLTYASPAVLAQLQEPFAVVVMAISAVLGNQAWHKLVNLT